MGPSVSEALIERIDGGLRLSGDITFATAGGLERQFAQIMADAGERQMVTIDFNGVDAADSSAIALLVEMSGALAKTGGPLRVTGMRDHLRSLMALYGIDWILTGPANK